MKKNKIKFNVIFLFIVFVSAVAINISAADYSSSSSYHSIYYRDNLRTRWVSTHFSINGGSPQRALINPTGNYQDWRQGAPATNGPSTIGATTGENWSHLHAYGSSYQYPENVR